MSEEMKNIIGERVRFFRITAGMKQKDLALKLGVSYQQVQKYETGKDKISINRLYDISKILCVPVISLLEEVGDISEIDHNRQALRLMDYFSKISHEKDRGIILDIVKILANKPQSQSIAK